MNSFIAALIVVIGGIALICGLGLLFSLPVYFLWNGCLVGAVAGVSEVTWLQAWGLSILCSFLFKPIHTNK